MNKSRTIFTGIFFILLTFINAACVISSDKFSLKGTDKPTSISFNHSPDNKAFFPNQDIGKLISSVLERSIKFSEKTGKSSSPFNSITGKFQPNTCTCNYLCISDNIFPGLSSTRIIFPSHYFW